MQTTAVKNILSECDNTLKHIEGRLVDQIKVVDISRTAKIPFKAITLAESLSYRFVDICRSGLLLIQRGHIVPAITLARASMETMSCMYTIDSKIQKCLEKNDLSGFDDFIMKRLFGQKMGDDTFPAAVNIMTAIDNIDRAHPGTKQHYSVLCEFAHPNMHGVHSAYCKIIHPEHVATFNNNNNESLPDIAITSLNMTIVLFDHYKCEFEDKFLDFVQLCEDDLLKQND